MKLGQSQREHERSLFAVHLFTGCKDLPLVSPIHADVMDRAVDRPARRMAEGGAQK